MDWIKICDENNKLPQVDGDNIRRFKATNFLPKIKQKLPHNDNTELLQNLTAAALYYFFSNQYGKITQDHTDGVNKLFLTAQGNIRKFMAAVAVLGQEDAATAETFDVPKANLQRLIATCLDEHFPITLVEAAVTNQLSLVSPFSDDQAYCQESYEVDGKWTCLRFTDGKQCFFLLQSISSADGLYFPYENILLPLVPAAGAAAVERLQSKLLERFKDIADYAGSTNNFSGIIASNPLPAHFYYDIWPALTILHKNQKSFVQIPALIMRTDQNLINLKLMFTQRNCLVLDTDDITRQALNARKWFVHIGNHPQRRTYFDYETANRYLVSRTVNATTGDAITKAAQIEGCYPLVWIGISAQKSHWLEQIEGYAYIINELGKRYLCLGVVIAGQNLPLTPSEKSLAAVQQERRIAGQLVKQLNPEIKQAVLVGENSNTTIFIGNKIDFFIGDFTDGSLYVSHLLAKPGFCHSSNVHAERSLNPTDRIRHPNWNVFLLPKDLVDISQPAVSYLQTATQSMLAAMKLAKKPKKPAINPMDAAYSIDKKAFYQFIGQHLDKVASNAKPEKLKFFLEPSFSIHYDVRHHLRMACHGNLLEVFPTFKFPRQIGDLSGFNGNYLKQHIIYGVFPFGGHSLLKQPGEYLIWLGEPLLRAQLHTLQFMKKAASDNKPSDMNTILNTGHKALDNYYTRLVSGLDVPYGKCTENMLNIAINNLSKHFIFIGINERQAQSFDRLCTLMDWDRALFPDELPKKFDVNADDLTEYGNVLADGLIKYDLRLYQAALALIDKQPLKPAPTAPAAFA